MENNYYKIEGKKSSIFVKLKYYSPNIDNNCYEGLIIILSENDKSIIQLIDNFENMDNFENNYHQINSDAFISFQEKYVLSEKRNVLYEKYYNEFKDYYLLKKKSIEDTKKTTQINDWNYYNILEANFKKNNVYVKHNLIKKIEANILQQNNLSELDIFYEARQNSTIDYTKNRL